MNKLRVPPAINWYRYSAAACSPDNTLIFGSKHDLVVIKEAVENNVDVIFGAHQNYVISVDVNRKWGEPHKYAVSLGEENVINLWDVDSLDKKLSNTELAGTSGSCPGVVFAGDGKVVSVSIDGKILLWNIVTNESKFFANLLDHKPQVSCLSSCPHAGWLVAFGLSNGHITVADLRGNGQVCYKMIGHEKSVVSLSWCPAPVNIFPEKPQNTVRNKTKIEQVTKDTVQLKNGNKVTETDFLQDCLDLKNKILGIETEPKVEIPDNLDKADLDESSFMEEPQEIMANREMPTIFDPSDNIFSCDSTNEFNASEIIDEIFDNVFENVSRIPENEIVTRTVESVDEEPRREFLLASSGRDRNIYIWRGGTDGRMQTFFPLPKKKFRQVSLQNSWITLCWISPNVLLSTSGNDELIHWTLPRPKDKNSQFKSVAKNHSFLMNIVSTRYYPTEYNWKDPIDDLKMWTFNQNGLCRNEFFNCRQNEIIFDFFTLQSSVSSLAISPLTPNCLAMGQKDNIIMWDLNFSTIKCLPLDLLHNKGFQKIFRMAFHPTNELLLACGSEEGKVAVVDIGSMKFKMMPMYFREHIHNIEWGPIDGDVNNLGVYAMAEGTVLMYDTSDKDFKVITAPDKKYIYRFAWKPDYSLLLINTKDTALHIYTTDLQLIQTIYLTDRCFTNILWHPNAKLNDPEQSPFCNWIAALTSKGFFTYNFDSLNDNDDDKCSQLESYEKPMMQLAWSPFEANKLATASFDGLFYVWDVLEKTILLTINIETFNKYGTIMWSPLDPDYVIVARSTIVVYKLSECPKRDGESVEVSKIEVKKKPTKKTKRNKGNKQIVPLRCSGNDTNIDKQISDMRLLMEKTTIGDLIGENLDKDDGIRVFGTRNDVFNLLTSIQNGHKSDGKYKKNDFIALMKGNIGDAIKEAITENRVDKNLVALAPMVSIKLWQETCETYGRQLMEEADSDPHEVVMYLLACHRVQDAINYLCDTLNFRDALTLAKCRLPDNSEITGKVTEKWAMNCANDGNYEFAAKCFISIGLYEKAAQVLLKRNTPEILQFAGELAEIAGNKELLDLINHKRNNLLEKETKNEMEEKENVDENGECSNAEQIDGLFGGNTIGFNQIQHDLHNRNKSLLSRAEIFIKKAENKNETDEMD